MIFLIFLSFFITLILINRVLPQLKRYTIDKPNNRSSHKRPTATGGGLIFALTGSIICSFSNFFIPLICLPISFIGFIDDNIGLKSLLRYIFQLIIALNLIYFSDLFSTVILFEKLTFILTILFLLLISTSIINFTNFMDGIDGLVAGCMAVILLTSSFYVDISLIIIFASLLAFLIFNWSPAKLFMGDAGSTFLGALFAGILLNCKELSDSIGLFIVSLPLLSDACICVIRRLISGQKFYMPHKLHLYQRLNQRGWSHSCISVLYIISTTFISVVFLIGGWEMALICFLIIFSIGFYLDQKVAVTFRDALNS